MSEDCLARGRSLRSVESCKGKRAMDKRIVVVGAGAIGGYTCGNLANNGFDVTLIDAWPEHIEAIRKNGLRLEGVTPEETIVVHPKTLHLTELQHLAK
jgi:2-dehydropantoate 2-reductase